MEPIFYRNPYNYYSPNRFRNNPYINNSYYNYTSSENNRNKNRLKTNIENKDNVKNEEKIDEPRKTSSDSSSKPIFELFGIKLFFDDILLISLIFFLYNEGVKDQSLFIALILLLLS